MRKARSTVGTSRTWSLLAASFALGTIGSLAMGAPAQPASPANAPARSLAQPAAKAQPVRRGRTQKQPLVNLEQQAQLRRPGQVMPGDPPPERFAPPMQEPAAAEAAPTPVPVAPAAGVKVEPGRDPASGRPVKPAAAPVDADSGPRPLPRSAASPKPQPVQTAAESLDAGVTQVPGSATASASDPDSPPVAPRPATERTRTIAPPAVPAEEESRAPVEPITVRVTSASGSDVQWRTGGAWTPLAAGSTTTDRFEVRTGLDGEATFDLDGRIAVIVGYVSKVTLENRSASRGAPVIVLERGSIELRAESSDPAECWVRTPDRSAGFAALPGVRVAYSAFSGTSLSSAGADARR